MSQLEVELIKKYCLHNYLDGLKGQIGEFVVELNRNQKTKEKNDD